MTEHPTPIFLFAPARSGSTLVQRILAANPEIATASEPHILLPLLYSLKTGGDYEEHDIHGIPGFYVTQSRKERWKLENPLFFAKNGAIQADFSSFLCQNRHVRAHW